MPHNFCIEETPMSQLGRELSTREVAADGLVVELGMRPARRLTPSANIGIPPSSVRFAWPSPSDHHPHRRDRGQRA